MVKIVIYGREYDVIRNTADQNYRDDNSEENAKPEKPLLDYVLSEAENYIAEKYFPTCDAEFLFKKGWSAWEKGEHEIHLFLEEFN